MNRLVVITDLDGTLLSHETYDWSPARPAVVELKRRGIPLVLASSKTRAEIEVWRERLGNADPFIVENGGALFVPTGMLSVARGTAVEVDGYNRIEFGTPYARLRSALPEIAGEVGVPLLGFGDMSREEIGRRTGLKGEDLERSSRREYDEPFVPERALSPRDEARLRAAAVARELRVTMGGRFFHLIGQSDKGVAARHLRTLYTGATGPGVTMMGLGDSANDLEMLQAVDRPVVVAGPDSAHDPTLRSKLPRAMFTRLPGPAGFAEAVLASLDDPGWVGAA